jgi:hypothetical protein
MFAFDYRDGSVRNRTKETSDRPCDHCLCFFAPFRPMESTAKVKLRQSREALYATLASISDRKATTSGKRVLPSGQNNGKRNELVRLVGQLTGN